MLNILSLESQGDMVVLTVGIQNTATYDDMLAEYRDAINYIRLFSVTYTKAGWNPTRNTIYYNRPNNLRGWYEN